LDGYVAPKKPYSFEAMLDDILAFAASTLVDNGRLSMWMPTANEENVEIAIPGNRKLEIVSICVQPFNKCESSFPHRYLIGNGDTDKDL
jgi:tRNA (guanine10-N2)-methyltransferase